MNKYAFGENLCRILKEKRVKQRWLADKIGTHQTTISGWINGRSVPSAAVVYKMSIVLEVTVEDLMKGTYDK